MATAAASPSRRRFVQADVIAVGLAGVLLFGLAVPRLVAAVTGPAAVSGVVETPLAGATSRDTSGERDLVAGLAREPADPAGWARLAALRGPDGGGAALAMSLSTGPHEGPEFWSRLDLCLADQGAIGGALDASLVQEQIRIGWRLAPERLVGVIRDHSAVALAQAAFAGRPEAARFAAMIGTSG
jgi:hypothetical protein